MFKTIEDIMYINDGIDPFKKHTLYDNMKINGNGMNDVYLKKINNENKNNFFINFKVQPLEEYIEEEEEEKVLEDIEEIKKTNNDNNINDDNDLFYYNWKIKNKFKENYENSKHNHIKFKNIFKKTNGGMIGGMSKINPLLDNKLTYETDESNNVDIDEFIEFIKENNDIDKKKLIEKHIDDIGQYIDNKLYEFTKKDIDKKKINNDLEKLNDLVDELNINDAKLKEKIEDYIDKNKDMTKEDVRFNKDIDFDGDIFKKENKYEKMLKEMNEKEFNKFKKDNGFSINDDITTIARYMRGNKIEDKMVKYQSLTDLYDDNDNDLITSKSDEFYNDDYVDYMKDFFKKLNENDNTSNLTVKDFDEMKNKFMIDTIKYGDNPILWEIKSHKGHNSYKDTKFNKSEWSIGDNKFIWLIKYKTNNGVKPFKLINDNDKILGIDSIGIIHTYNDKPIKIIQNVLRNKTPLRYGILDVGNKGTKVYNVLDDLKNIKNDIPIKNKYNLTSSNFKYTPTTYTKDYLRTIDDIKKEYKENKKKVYKKDVGNKYKENILRINKI